MIFSIFIVGFMGIGYFLVRKKSIILRIIIPAILGIVGFYTGGIVALSLGTH